jgi:hypothetical protein
LAAHPGCDWEVKNLDDKKQYFFFLGAPVWFAFGMSMKNFAAFGFSFVHCSTN